MKRNITWPKLLLEANSNIDNTAEIDNQMKESSMQKWKREKTPSLMTFRQKVLSKSSHFIQPTLTTPHYLSLQYRMALKPKLDIKYSSILLQLIAMKPKLDMNKIQFYFN